MTGCWGHPTPVCEASRSPGELASAEETTSGGAGNACSGRTYWDLTVSAGKRRNSALMGHNRDNAPGAPDQAAAGARDDPPAGLTDRRPAPLAGLEGLISGYAAPAAGPGGWRPPARPGWPRCPPGGSARPRTASG